MSEQQFDQWCIVELMGHQRMAGRVTEQTVGGASFVRVDVPAVNDRPAFTRLLGASAIYAINPVSEEVACAAAKIFRPEPVAPYEIPALRQAKLSAQSEQLDVVEDHCPECGQFERECICVDHPF